MKRFDIALTTSVANCLSLISGFKKVLVGIFVYFRPELISIVFFKTHCSRTHRDVYFYTALSVSPAWDYSQASQPCVKLTKKLSI